jgi:hypothetical protein
MWAPEHKRFLHERRERQWLRSKAKHTYIDYSDSERAALKMYFDALAGPNSMKMPFDKLEDMLISLGLAETKKDVCNIVDQLDPRGVNAFKDDLDFEEYLEIVRKRTGSDVLPVFKAMMEGRLGDQNLNFETVISQYRRKMFIKFLTAKTDEKKGVAKGRGEGAQKDRNTSPRKGSPKANESKASPKDPKLPDAQKKGEEVLANFATLQKARFDEARAAGEKSHHLLPFEAGGVVPTGGLEMVWRTVVTEQGLVSSRPSSADGNSKRREPPMSPRTVVNSCLKVKLPTRRRGRTIIVREAALDTPAERKPTKSGGGESWPNSPVGSP